MDLDQILANMKAEGWVETANEDTGGFKPLKGEYITTVTAVERKSGTSDKTGNPYDFVALKVQVQETVSGDKGDNRYIDGITFPLLQDFGLPALCNTAFTIGVTLDKSSVDALLESANQLVGKTAYVRAYEKDGFQKATVVKEFKTKKEAVNSSF